MKAAFDTNILVYASGANDAHRYSSCLSLLHAATGDKGVVPAQVLAEYFHVMTRKYGWSIAETAAQVGRYRCAYEISPTSSDCLEEASQLSTAHSLQIFDAIIIASAAIAGCRVLFSEDMRHDTVFNGVTIVNPFAEPKHPMLLSVLNAARGRYP